MDGKIPLDYLSVDEKLIIFSDLVTSKLLAKVAELTGENEEILYQWVAVDTWQELFLSERTEVLDRIEGCRSTLKQEQNSIERAMEV